MQPHQCRGEDHLPQPAGNILPNAAVNVFGLLWGKHILLIHGQLVVHQDPQVLQSCSPVGWCPAYTGAWGFPHQGQGFEFPLVELNFMRFPCVYFSNLSRTLWMATQPSGVSCTAPSFISYVIRNINSCSYILNNIVTGKFLVLQ